MPLLSCRGVVNSGAASLVEIDLFPPPYLLNCCGTIHSTLRTAMQEKKKPSGIYLEWLQESKDMTRDEAGALKVQKWMSKQVTSAQQGCMAAQACGSKLATTIEPTLGLGCRTRSTRTKWRNASLQASSQFTQFASLTSAYLTSYAQIFAGKIHRCVMAGLSPTTRPHSR